MVQLAGYVSEHSAYHHGEASLNGTITAMAQNYTGSNNLNLLTPGGQFGTRLMGGKASALTMANLRFEMIDSNQLRGTCRLEIVEI